MCGVIAKEGRDVATVNLLDSFLQTEQEVKDLLLKLTGKIEVFQLQIALEK